MSSSQSDLEELRRRIDGIDNSLLELLVERLKIVEQVALLKSNGAATYVPAREAAILRRLVARGRDDLPVGMIVRMWRELLGATVRREGPFAVGAHVPPQGLGLWDMARDHYGSHTQLTTYQSTSQVIRAVTDRRVSVGVLPMPQDDDADPWWLHLLSPDAEVPRVIARLPFGPLGNARCDGDALAIGYGEQQPSGSDRTLIATENAVDISHGRFIGAFSALGMTPTMICSSGQSGAANTLIELDGFVPVSGARVEQLQERLGGDLLRVFAIGSYAVPLADAGSPASAGRAQPMAMSAAYSARG